MAITLINPDELIADGKAASILGVKTQTLTTWRSEGRGPAYVKIGRRVYYHRPDILAFIAAGRRVPDNSPEAA